jgi:hypothetical protein
MISLFEYGKWSTISERETLEDILLSVWQSRIFTHDFVLSDNEKDKRYQPFFTI